MYLGPATTTHPIPATLTYLAPAMPTHPVPALPMHLGLAMLTYLRLVILAIKQLTDFSIYLLRTTMTFLLIFSLLLSPSSLAIPATLLLQQVILQGHPPVILP